MSVLFPEDGGPRRSVILKTASSAVVLLLKVRVGAVCIYQITLHGEKKTKLMNGVASFVSITIIIF